MQTIEQQYLGLLEHIMTQGPERNDRTGVGTRSVFGYELRHDFSQGFPLLTTKKVYWKGVVIELLWMLSGLTNIEYLQQNNVHIWDEWANEAGELGPVYGKQWRAWQTAEGQVIDQMSQLVDNLKNNPTSRRHVISAWNVGQLADMALPPCHLLFQFYVTTDEKLWCKLTQRSADVFLGVPFNIASYSLMTMMLAQQCNLQPGGFIWSGGDCHIYSNHIEQVSEQLARTPYLFPEVKIQRQPADLFSYQYEDFEVVNYQSHATIKAPIAV